MVELRFSYIADHHITMLFIGFLITSLAFCGVLVTPSFGKDNDRHDVAGGTQPSGKIEGHKHDVIKTSYRDISPSGEPYLLVYTSLDDYHKPIGI